MPPLKLTQTETRPKAKIETRPAAQNMLTHGQRPMPKHSRPKPSLVPQAKSGARPTLAHAAVGASAKRENVYFYEQKKCLMVAGNCGTGHSPDR